MYRPTTIRYASQHCPAAMDHYDNGTFYGKDHFAVGVAAHVVLEHMGKYTNATGEVLSLEEADEVSREAAKALISQGRRFEDTVEPPLDPNKVEEGRQLALGWQEVDPLQPGAQVEVGLGFASTPSAASWQLVEYDPSTNRFRTILDRMSVIDEGDEEDEWTVLEVLDFKSSWAADESELETVQRKLQAIVAVDWAEAKGHEWDLLRLVVANLRTRTRHTLELERGSERLDEWRRQLSETMVALDQQERPRPARPGAGCWYCPFVLRCEPARQALPPQWTGDDEDQVDPRRAAEGYAVLESTRLALAPVVRRAASGGTLAVDGGSVGYQAVQRRRLATGAVQEVWRAWSEDQVLTEDLVLGLLEALGLGVTQVDNVAKAIFPGRNQAKARQRWVDGNTELYTAKVFKVVKE